MVREFGELLKNKNVVFDYNESKNDLYIAIQPYDNSFEIFEDEYSIVKTIYELKEDILDYYVVDSFALLLCYTWLDGLRETNSELMQDWSVLSNECESKKL